MTIETPREKLASLQCLRGIAALMVVLYHLGVQLERDGWRLGELYSLMGGVDIFFVISGFIMWHTTRTRPERGGLSFLRDRLIRIAPSYWLVTLLIVIGMLLFRQTLGQSSPDAAPAAMGTSVKHIIFSFLFIPAIHPVKEAYFPVLIAGWTLNIEMFFYVLFALAIAVSGRQLPRRASLIVIALVAFALFGWFANPPGIVGFLSENIIAEFAAGILLGVLFATGRVRQSKLWLLLCAAGWAGMVHALQNHGLPRCIELGIPAVAIVAGVLFGTPYAPKALQRLGDWSYSLYITHQITLTVMHATWRRLGLDVDWTYAVIAVGGPILVSYLFFRFAEVPLLSFFQSRFGEKARGPRLSESLQPGSSQLPSGREGSTGTGIFPHV